MSNIIEERVTGLNKQPGVRRYFKGRLLGRGSLSECFELISLETNRVFAGKRIPRSALQNSNSKNKLMSEIKLHRFLHHPKIVTFEHFFEDSSSIYLLLGLCQNQTLHHLLKRRGVLTEPEVKFYAFQLLTALKFLRTRRIIHRDLRPSNLFLSDTLEVKLGDFGLATQLNSDSELKWTVCGTPNYMAPEVLDNTKGYSYEVDLWAFGVIMYTLFVGRPPFDALESEATIQRIKKVSYAIPEHVPETAKNLIYRILKLDPLRRITLEEIQNHEFFRVEVPQSLPLSSLTVAPYQSTAVEELEVPQELVKVEKWFDFSAQYGLGYILTNGCVGACFNDKSRLIQCNERLMYIQQSGPQRQQIRNFYTLDEYPSELAKKVSILRQFSEGAESQVDCSYSLYVQKWMKTRYAILFRFSNKLVQVSFHDGTALLLSSDKKSVTYYSKSGDPSTCLMKDAVETTDHELLKRLEYARDLLAGILTRPKDNNNFL